MEIDCTRKYGNWLYMQIWKLIVHANMDVPQLYINWLWAALNYESILHYNQGNRTHAQLSPFFLDSHHLIMHLQRFYTSKSTGEPETHRFLLAILPPKREVYGRLAIDIPISSHACPSRNYGEPCGRGVINWCESKRKGLVHVAVI